MVDYLIKDYKSNNGNLSKKPHKIVLILNITPPSKSYCTINTLQKVYNPFVLGKKNHKYE